MANSIDPDGVAHDEPPHQDLRCLQNRPFFVSGTQSVKPCEYISFAKVATEEVRVPTFIVCMILLYC